MSIDMNKTYRTRDGRPVRVYAVDGAPTFSIHGAMKEPHGWEANQWSPEGYSAIGFCEGGCQLVEITLADELTQKIPWEALRPEIRWVAMHNNGIWCAFTHQPATSQESRYWSAAVNTTSWALDPLNMPEVKNNRWRETLCRRPEGR